MRALVYTAPNRLELREAPEPRPANDEAVVKVSACGICGSDMHGYHGFDDRRPPPVILGHEASGVVTSGRLAGKRVTINPLVTCGTCDFCLGGRQHLCRSRQILSLPPRDGAFAEMVRVPEQNLVEIPDGLDTVKAALAEPLAVSYHAVQLGLRLLARPKSASRVVVLGGGAIGMGCALVAAMEGVGEIHIGEPNAGRRSTLGRVGSFQAYQPGSPQEPAAGSVDLILDAVGAEATRAAASRLAAPGGSIVHIGLLPGLGGLDVRRITLQEINFVGTYCYTPVDFRETVAAMAAGRLGALDWFEERPLAEGQAAFADIDAGKVSMPKIILRM